MSQCIICEYGITNEHHIIPKSNDGNNSDTNKIELCPNHHRAIHILMQIDNIMVDKLKREKARKKGYAKMYEEFLYIYDYDEKVVDYYNERIKPKIKDIFLSDSQIFRLVEKQCKK